MKRRQVLQTFPALATLALLPSIASAKPEIELPPALMMWLDKPKGVPGVIRIEAAWIPYGDEEFLLTNIYLRTRALWWPPALPYWGPATSDQLVRDFKEEIARNYRESRLFYEKYGISWIRANNLQFFPEPEFHKSVLKQWHKIRGEWKLEWSIARARYTKEEEELARSARQAWLDSGKTDEDAYPGWYAT